MTEVFSDMIYLFSCGALGIMPKRKIKTDMESIYKEAVRHEVTHILFPIIKQLHDSADMDIDKSWFHSFKYHTMAAVSANTKRSFFIHRVLQSFQSEGIDCCVLKGETLSHLYAFPEGRISSDTDILINARDIDRAKRILYEYQFDIKPISATSHHFVAFHQDTGIVELHFQLYDKLFEDTWFDNKILNQEEFISLKVSDGFAIPTLGITDGLIFVTLHYIKHFLLRGVGIRQLMDMLLYMKRYKEQIDWERFDGLMDYLNYKKFIDHTIGVGIKYLNFEADTLPSSNSSDEILLRLLEDIELGGIFGRDEIGRNGIHMVYTKERFSRFRKDSYSEYIKKWWVPNIVRIAFPHIKIMTKKYPYVNQNPVIYPIAWVHRIFHFFIKLKKRTRSIAEIVNPEKLVKDTDVNRKRMDLIRDLEMV